MGATSTPLRITLPFQPRWRSAVVDGSKTTTCRTKRYGAAGDEFEVDGVAFRLVSVETMPLAQACARHWRDEGMASAAEFEATWRENHPTRGYRAEDTVWVHRFTRAA